MFFDDINDIPAIALSTGCAVFVVGDSITKESSEGVFFADRKLGRAPSFAPWDADSVSAKKHSFELSYILSPTDKPSITVEQVRDFTAKFNTKQTKDVLAVITPADALSTAAQNAFLKNLEEPQPHVHYILLTAKPTKLLPTILSRAQVFYLKTTDSTTAPPSASPEIQALAKQLITAKPHDLPALATQIAKTKNAREQALEITATAIELLYKSYFKTKNPSFLKKISKFTTLYDNLAMNGHIKLHLVADLC